MTFKRFTSRQERCGHLSQQMAYLLERSMNSMNSFFQTNGHAPRRTRTGHVGIEAPGLSRFSRQPVHWPRATAPPPLFYLWLLHGAAQYRLGPMPTLRAKARRLGTAKFLRSFTKAHSNQIIQYPRENILYVVLSYIAKPIGWKPMLFQLKSF